MFANNWQRLNVVLSMTNRFDYSEFKNKCAERGCEPLPALEFAQKVGIVCAAECYAPDLPIGEAYLLFVKNNQVAFTPPSSVLSNDSVAAANASTSANCSSCGGGSVK